MREPERDESATFDPQPRSPIGGHRGRRALRRPGRPTLRPTLLAAGLALAAAPPAAAGDIRIDGSFVSTAPTGTPPLSVASTTRVDGLNADLLDGLDASAFSPAPDRVLVVSPSGGHFASVQAALDSITDASASKRYLVRVGPGIYQERVSMKPFVDIEGSGEGLTLLLWSGLQTVFGASDAELRDLTVENFDDGVSGGWGIRNVFAAPRIVRVTVRVTASAGAPIGIVNTGATSPLPVLRRVTVSATGPGAVGINNFEVGALIYDSEIHAIGNSATGIRSQNGAHSKLVRVTASATDVTGASEVAGVQSFDSFVEMVDVEASAVGGSVNRAVYNSNVSQRVRMTRVRAFAQGGSTTYGVYNWLSDADIVDCEIRGSAASTSNHAVFTNRASTRIYRSTLTASGTNPTHAFVASVSNPGDGGGPWAVQIHASQLWGQSTLVSNAANVDTRIGASWLGGGGSLVNSGTLVCAGVYDDGFTFYAETCP